MKRDDPVLLGAQTLLLGAPDVARVVSAKGVPAGIAGIAERIEADFARWSDFDKTPRVAAHGAEGVIELQTRRDCCGRARAPSGSSTWYWSGALHSRCAGILAIAAGSSMLAMILSFPPQRAQLSISTPKTRCRRRGFSPA